tara:strand:- start:6229 stop:6972 length:744 start_codon:yes stop_codon:yes gene_type:complete
METSLDSFLDGRLRIAQPVNGYRAATDPVFLAASVPVQAGQSVLDVGCGVGVATLCLNTRVSGLDLVGVEIQSEYAELARENAVRNDVQVVVENSDLATLSADFRTQVFDHVMTNPPFFEPNKQSTPKNAEKTVAHVETLSLPTWIALSLRRLRPKGSFTIIHLSERLPEILGALNGACGDLRVLPIASRVGKPAKRVLVQGIKTSKAPMRLLAPLIVHDGEQHVIDGDDFAEGARNILRNGAAIKL